MRYTIWIVTPPNYPHSRCFEEVAIALNSGIMAHGHECKIVTSSFECRGRTIVLGAHLLERLTSVWDFPEDMVVYNLEQVVGSEWFNNEYINLLRGRSHGKLLTKDGRKFEVWDYAQANVDALAAMGVSAKLCGIGYALELTRIENMAEPDIDVLHVGSMNHRREYVLKQLEARGVKVCRAFNEYGLSRDALISRSKIVLNMHFYESRVFEIVRCSYLMANRKCIVSETGNDKQLEGRFSYGIAFYDYDRIVDACVDLLADDARREHLAERGFEIFSWMRQKDMLGRVL